MQHILGQDRAIEILSRALASGRLHHAWIFSGPRGVGKFTTAVEFARILLDPDAGPNLAGQFEAHPHGRTSRLIDAEAHPDLHVIRKELALFSENPELRRRKLMNIPLDVLREHMIGGKSSDDRYHDGPAYRTAALGHGKVFIVDEAELIDRNGQNTLLKTLEEPPAETYLVLVTARAEQLLPTIRSRCQHVRFGPLDAESMSQWLERAKLPVQGEARAWIERFAEGSPGMAQLASEYGFAEWGATLGPMLRQLDDGVYPSAMGEALAAMIESFAQAWVKKNKNASKDAANKDGARHLLSLLAAHARRRLRDSCRDGDESSRWADVIDLIRAAEQHLERNVNLKQALENLVVQWARSAARPVAAV